ncbi:uncharacterized protein LOC127257974 [Andrographis paniculata]|uniref:uncharacterized protein LOC127257974 n=1 Tax=Andrographis paniculata TaxID=175694 RepID=UPI0021E8F3E3|nr:uncharacterized protein LOC127257974 [Andrographis paniculata]XP_051140543.1 uncharacterized protein LOC127257974 [Andrographis paniculata]
MSAKWRAIQHRHRYTYSAVVFPPEFILALNQAPHASPFFDELKRLISLSSTYAQLEHAKKVAAEFSKLLSDPTSDEKLISSAVRFYLEILLLENSLPLHRTLASVLAKCKNFRSLIEQCFRQLCEEYGGGESGRNGKKRFCVSRAALSMMSTPKLGYLVQVVEQCAVLVALDVVLGLHSVVTETNELSRPSPIVMEQCQEALSCLYYLLQRFPDQFSNAGAKHHELGLIDGSVLEMAFSNILIILRSQGFSRDCFVAAGVSFFAALQVCLSPDELGLFIMEGFFHQTNVAHSTIELNAVLGKAMPYKGDLVGEISKCSALSRLCLIRGILTAVSRTVLNNLFVLSNDSLSGCTDVRDGDCSVKTILYDAILPELCSFAENPTDSHSNFHALTVMQICLQQIKTLLHSDTDGVLDGYDPIPEEMGGRILKIVWNNLEDPLSQTVKQVHLIFDLYLDILSSLPWAEGSETTKLFLRKIASDLLCLGPRCKGRYVPLASVTRRLGAKAVLNMNPDLVFETANAYIDDDVCCAATTFLKCFLECLRDEYWSSDGVNNGYTKYRSHCLPPFLHGLACGVAKLRSNLSTYALPVLLELDVDCIFNMLALIGTEWDDGPLFDYTEISSSCLDLQLEQQISVLISLLKVSRVLALMEGDIELYENEISPMSSKGAVLDVEDCNFQCVVNIKNTSVKVPVKWLILALTHLDESLRMDAAETLFLNPKTAHLPSSLELILMRQAIPLNMRCSSSAFQMKWNSLFRKFFSRVRTALERQLKQGTWNPHASGDVNGLCIDTGAENPIKLRAKNLFNFTKWLSCFLFFSCYPSAPYERKIMAMDLLLVMLNVWPLGNEDALNPYSKSFTSPNSTLQLVGSIVDSWDRLRVSSFRILLNFPTLLPGFAGPDLVREAIIWAKKLVCSPRVRESDAGALTLRLFFRKYVEELGWIVEPSSNVVSLASAANLPNGSGRNGKSNSPVVSYVISLIDWLLSSVEDAEKNLLEACKNSFVHGILLTLRYTFEELDWDSNVFLDSFADMKHALERLLELVMRITSLALWVVSADAWHIPEDMEEMVDEESFLLESPDEIDSSGQKLQSSDEDKNGADEIRSSEQIVMVGCWLAMKELSLLLGTLTRKVPLPTSGDLKNTVNTTTDEYLPVSDGMLNLKQLETIGNHFLEVLVKMKHNGAIDKTRAGFTALCNRLLCSDDSRLCKLTESWMEKLMERTVAKGQTVDDLLRRSAGIPAAFIAFFLSEPEGTPKRLLPKALYWLIDVIKESLANQHNAMCDTNNICRSKSSQETSCTPLPGTNSELSKFRDEGVVPTVHAFNVLRAAFNDTNLATDTSGFCAEALILAVRSFSSPYWEVRNSACLAYTALVRRMVGFLNIQKRESARRAITGLEFFHRYPALHPFLFNELQVATALLLNGSSEQLKSNSNLINVVHPSLCPMLILLSRLKPSPLSSETGDPLDPFLFMPFIRRCAVQRNFRIRVLASGALVGLVSNEKLQEVMLNIASELPCEEIHNRTSDSSTTSDSANNMPFSFNAIHGMLLQLNALVDINCRNLADSSKQDKVLHKLGEILAARQWIGRPQWCPCPILNSSMLKVLDNMLSIARSCQGQQSAGVIWSLLWELSSECLDLEHASGWSYFDPTIQELRKQAATSYFNCVLQTSKDAAEDVVLARRLFSLPSPSSRIVGVEVAFTGFQERLIRSMSDASYEVRIATLKWLYLFLKGKELSGDCYEDPFYCEAMNILLANINLQDTLTKLMASEKHHKCMRYLVKILYIWNSLEFQGESQPSSGPRYIWSMDWVFVFHLWKQLVSLLAITRHAKTRESLICILGICIKQISNLYLSSISEMGKSTGPIQVDQSSSFSDFYDSLSYFVKLIERKSDASEPVNMRKAAAESLVASGLLAHADVLGPLVSSYPVSDRNILSSLKSEESIGLFAHKVLDLWVTCIKLLEDEDVGIRKRLALDVQKHFLSIITNQNSGPSVSSCQVEKVIESCFKYLSSVFGAWLDYLDYLCGWVMNTANNANYTVSGDLVRRVFDKEIDNYHEEKLLICQICCSQIEDVQISKPKARDLLYKWRSRFFEQLMRFIHEHMGKGESADWIGGVCNHKDAFLPLYANLLAFCALSNCILKMEPESSYQMMMEVSALEDAIRPFLGNPLISNLYAIVINSLGESAANLSQKWKDSNSIWVEFNPYFLLK